MATDKQYREAINYLPISKDDIAVYSDAKVKRIKKERGAWVEAYVWVYDCDVEQEQEQTNS